MNFIWNDAKRQANLKKHRLDFAEALRVFAGHTLTRPDTRFSYGEARLVLHVGLLGVEMVVIAHTGTEDTTQVISMQRAERHEREYYFASL